MSEYTIPELGEYGPPYAMAMLLECLERGGAFIKYEDISVELERQLDKSKIFPIHIGHVAGSLMNLIHEEYDEDAPLINALVVGGNDLPGKGIGGYFANLYEEPRYENWDDVSIDEKIDLVQEEREKVFSYPHWLDAANSVFGSLPELMPVNHDDGDVIIPPSGGHGGVSESKEHKRLKQWVAENPRAIGLRKAFGTGKQEARLLSGDTADVVFVDGNHFVMVEVKSCRSNDNDLQRGVYQCVKYRSVKQAEHLPYEIKVDAVLVTERDLPADLKSRTRVLGVKHKVASVN